MPASVSPQTGSLRWKGEHDDGNRDIDGPVIRHVERLLLPVLVADEHYSDDEFSRFLASVRKLLDI